MRIALAGTWVPLPSQGGDHTNFNLALGYLEATLDQRLQGVQVARVHTPMPLGDDHLAPSVADEVLATDPQVVGLSSFCWDSDAFEGLAAELKRRSPSCKVILGGPTATFDAPAFMRRTPAVDVAVRGEGETALVELLQGGLHDPSRVAGVMYRDGEALRETSPRPPIANLDDLPSPYLSGVARPPRNHFSLECSRGCVFRCKHCAWKNYLGTLRSRAPERIAGELQWALSNGHHNAFVLDAAINFDTERLDALTASIASAIPFGAIRFSYFLSHHHYEPAQLPLLSRIAAHELWLGVESFHPPALKAVSRPPLDPCAFERLLDELSVLGPIHLSIMLGIPGDDLAGFKRTVDLIARMSEGGPRPRIKSVRVFWTLVPPGSFFAEHRESLGIRTPSRGMPYVLHTHSFPESDLQEAMVFLGQHRLRGLFLWDDPQPSRYFPRLAGLDLQRRPSLHSELGDSRQALARLHALLPWSSSPRVLGGGWALKSTFVLEGWPTLSFEKGKRCVVIQVRARSKDGPFFVQTPRHDLLWIAERGAPMDPELPSLMGFVAGELRKREGSP